MRDADFEMAEFILLGLQVDGASLSFSESDECQRHASPPIPTGHQVSHPIAHPGRFQRRNPCCESPQPLTPPPAARINASRIPAVARVEPCTSRRVRKSVGVARCGRSRSTSPSETPPQVLLTHASDASASTILAPASLLPMLTVILLAFSLPFDKCLAGFVLNKSV